MYSTPYRSSIPTIASAPDSVFMTRDFLLRAVKAPHGALFGARQVLHDPYPPARLSRVAGSRRPSCALQFRLLLRECRIAAQRGSYAPRRVLKWGRTYFLGAP